MEKKCWICNRTAEEIRKFHVDKESYKDNELFSKMGGKLRDKERWYYCHGLVEEGKSIYVCNICRAIITVIMQKDFENYSISGEISDLKIGLD